MTKIALGGNMPASTVANGLPGLVDDLVADETQTVLALVEIKVNYAKVRPGETDPETLVMQLGHIEPVLPGNSNYERVDKLMDTLFTKRTSESVRPSKSPKPQETELDMPEAEDDGVGI